MINNGIIACLREGESGDTLTPEVDGYASNELTPTGGCKGLPLSLQTNACCDTMSCLNLPWLSSILPIIKLEKSYQKPELNPR